MAMATDHEYTNFLLGVPQCSAADADGAGESDASSNDLARDDSPPGSDGGGDARPDETGAEPSVDELEFDMEEASG